MLKIQNLMLCQCGLKEGFGLSYLENLIFKWGYCGMYNNKNNTNKSIKDGFNNILYGFSLEKICVTTYIVLFFFL